MVAGLATGLAIFVALKLVEGLQEYIVPPDAFKLTPDPIQVLSFEPASAIILLTVIVTESDAEHPIPSVTNTEYVVVTIGVAMGLKIVVSLSPDEGLHANVIPPDAPRVIFPPMQIVSFSPASAGGERLTVTVNVVVFEHKDKSVPVIVYVVLLVGFAVTIVPVVELSPLAGAHK